MSSGYAIWRYGDRVPVARKCAVRVRSSWRLDGCHDDTSTLQHDALPFSGPGGFVAAAVDVVRDALDHDAVPVVLADRRQIAEVRVGGRRADDGARLRHVGRRAQSGADAARAAALRRRPPRPAARLRRRAGSGRRSGRRASARSNCTSCCCACPPSTRWNCRLTCAYDADALAAARVVDAIEAAHRARHAPIRPTQVERARAELAAAAPDDAARNSASTARRSARCAASSRAGPSDAGLDASGSTISSTPSTRWSPTASATARAARASASGPSDVGDLRGARPRLDPRSAGRAGRAAAGHDQRARAVAGQPAVRSRPAAVVPGGHDAADARRYVTHPVRTEYIRSIWA